MRPACPARMYSPFPVTSRMPFSVISGQTARPGRSDWRVNRTKSSMVTVPARREATSGRKRLVWLPRLYRIRYTPKLSPAIKGRLRSVSLTRMFFSPPSGWEMNQMATSARPNPANVRAPGKPSRIEPTITGSSAAVRAETGAATLILPAVMDLKNKSNPRTPMDPATVHINREVQGRGFSPENQAATTRKASPTASPNRTTW